MRCDGLTGTWHACPTFGTPATDLIYTDPAQLTVPVYGAFLVIIVALVLLSGLLFIGTLD